MTTSAVAVHSIIRKGGEIAPGTITEFEDDEFEELLTLGAVRTLSPDEARVDAALKSHVEEHVDHERLALEARADALGVKYNKNLSDEKLAGRISEAEAKAAEKAKAEEEAKAAAEKAKADEEAKAAAEAAEKAKAEEEAKAAAEAAAPKAQVDDKSLDI